MTTDPVLTQAALERNQALALREKARQLGLTHEAHCRHCHSQRSQQVSSVKFGLGGKANR